MSESRTSQTAIELACDVVSAYVASNSVPASELPGLIASVHGALVQAAGGVAVPVAAKRGDPAVPVKRSITPGYLVCLEDGKHFKSLKRHLRSKYGMTPEQYRAKWDLPADYPMVCSDYAAARSALAKSIGLGSGRRAPAAVEEAPTAVQAPEAKVAKERRGGRRADSAAPVPAEASVAQVEVETPAPSARQRAAAKRASGPAVSAPVPVQAKARRASRA